MVYDKIIIGAGLYGLYAALYSAKLGKKVLVLEYDSEPFMRATYINQARVHMGYHYPRSISTAAKSAGYFERFHQDYSECIHNEFEQVYGTSKTFSWTNASQFKSFCKIANIQCDEVPTGKYFKDGMCDGAFITKEYTYDAQILKKILLEQIYSTDLITLSFHVRIQAIDQSTTHYTIHTKDGSQYESAFILNASYASVNQIHSYLGFDSFKIKYELCEIILCEINDKFRNTGITVMDGPFFSIMPFGKTGLHSLTSVTFTPHRTSFDPLPTFDCQGKSGGYCSNQQLGNCNQCAAKPESAWNYMSHLAKKYLLDEYKFTYKTSLFSMKPILKASEIDDSRPTVIKKYSSNPTFISVLSGKINTVYDLDDILKQD